MAYQGPGSCMCEDMWGWGPRGEDRGCGGERRGEEWGGVYFVKSNNWVWLQLSAQLSPVSTSDVRVRPGHHIWVRSLHHRKAVAPPNGAPLNYSVLPKQPVRVSRSIALITALPAVRMHTGNGYGWPEVWIGKVLVAQSIGQGLMLCVTFNCCGGGSVARSHKAVRSRGTSVVQ